MIGLSLSLCIKDIINNKVAEADVVRIIAATAADTECDWDSVLDDYSKSYWRKDPVRAKQIVARLRNEARIDQPRLRKELTVNIAAGWWVKDEAELEARRKDYAFERL